MMSSQEFSQQIKDIYRKYEAEKRDSRSLLPQIENYLRHISSEFNSMDGRFVIELIQNAVDSYKIDHNGQAIPVRIKFYLEQGRLIVANDGQPFSTEDVDRICGMQKQYKGLKKIGYKGIGFKSVAAITHNPQIYSPGCYFEFDQAKHRDDGYLWLVIPHLISPDQVDKVVAQYPDWVTFILPFHPDRKSQLAHQFEKDAEIASGALLLFLDNLAELEIRNDPVNKHLHLRKEINNNNLIAIKEKQATGIEKELGQWLVVSETLKNPPPDAAQNYMEQRRLKALSNDQTAIDLGETKISVAFHLQQGNTFMPKESSVYAFFKVDHEKSGLPFMIQADFLTTPARDRLLQNNAWNNWLIKHLPIVLEKAVMQLQQYYHLPQVIYQVLPCTDDGEGPFKQVVATIIKRAKELPIIITTQNQWVKPAAAIWLEPKLRGLLEDKDLTYLYPHQSRAFVSFDEKLNDDRVKKFLLETLKIVKIDNKQFLEFLHNREWLKTKANSWFVLLFQHLMTLTGAIQKDKVKDLLIIPTTNGLAKASDDKLFLPARDNLTVTGAKLVAREVASALNVVDFLHKELHLETVTPSGLVDQVIIPALKQPLTSAIRQEYLEFVAAHYQNLPPKTRQPLAQYLLIEAQDGTWQPLNQLYLAQDNSQQPTLAHYLLPSKYLVADSPLIKFYKDSLGVKSDPTAETLGQLFKDRSWLIKKDLTWFQVLYSYLADLRNSKAISDLTPLYIGTSQLLWAKERVYIQPDSLEADWLETEKINFVSPDLFKQPTQSPNFTVNPDKIRSFLEKIVGIDEYNPLSFIKSTVVSEFEKVTDKGHNKLIDYTILTIQTLQHTPDTAILNKLKQVVWLKTTTGQWCRPADIYLTQKYGAADFETLFMGLDVHFISSIYLEKLPNQQAWVEFLSELGLKNQLEIIRRSPQERLDKLEKQYTPYFQAIKDTQIEGKEVSDLDKLNFHRLLKHISLRWLAEIIAEATPNRLEILLTLLAEQWQPDLAEVQYERWWEKNPLPTQTRPSHLAWLLLNNAILPTNQGMKQPKSQTIYNDSLEIRHLVGDNVTYLKIKLEKQAELAAFLGIITHPSKVMLEDVKNHLRYLKTKSTAQVNICLEIYRFLADKGEYGVLEEEQLVYVPLAHGQWWSPSKLFWSDSYQETFGEQRGYMEKSYPPESKAMLTKIGVKSEPKPQDWADLLSSLPQNHDLIWQAYQQLELFLRTEPSVELLDWWADFALNVKLLTESAEFVSPNYGVYLPDKKESDWYGEFKQDLPFLALEEKISWQDYKHLFSKLKLRQLRDWLEFKPQIKQEVHPEAAGKLAQKIANNSNFIYSILKEKTDYDNEAKAEFEGILSEGKVQVKLVDSLEVLVSIRNHPEIAPIPSEDKRAFYDATERTLNVFISKHDIENIKNSKERIEREVGRAVATIFEKCKDKVAIYFAELFVCKEKSDKEKLLADYKIPFITAPVNPPPDQPDKVTGQIKELLSQYSTNKELGNLGEAYAVTYLRQQFGEEYPLEWLNKTGESYEPFDIKTTQYDGTLTYWEVKTTQGEFQEWFMSMQEWMFAAEQGDNYHILRVFNAGTKEASVVDIVNPVQQWRDRKLTIERPICVRLPQ